MNGLEFTDFTISIDLARMCGLKWYFPGTTCPNGHISKRNMSNRECRSCIDLKRHRQRLASPEKARSKDRERYHRDPVKRRALLPANRAKHVEKRRASDRKRYWENPER